MAAPDAYEADAQDMAEVFDETNLTEDGVDLANFDELQDVFDATSAVGDARDIEAMDEADFDEEAIDDEDLGEDEESADVIRALDDIDDEDDDDLRDDTPFEAARTSVETRHDRNEVPVSFVADADALIISDSQPSGAYESEGPLSDQELKTLGYDDKRKPPVDPLVDPSTGVPGSGKTLEDVAEQSDPRQEDLLDEGIEETFPASDPVSVKRIT